MRKLAKHKSDKYNETPDRSTIKQMLKRVFQKSINKPVELSILAGIVFYVFDAFIDHIIFYGSTFAGSLITDVPIHEIYMRLAVVSLLLLIGLMASRFQGILKKTAEEHDSILKTSLDGFWILDAKGRFLDVNKPYCDMTGYSEMELLDMCVADVDAEESDEEISELIEKTIKFGYNRFESRHRCRDGTVIDVEISTDYLPVDKGKFFVFIRDITDSRIFEREIINRKKQLDELITNVNAIILEGDPSNIFYIGGQVEKLLGYNKKEWFGHPDGAAGFWLEHVHPDDKMSALSYSDRVKKGEDDSFEYKMITKEGEVLWFYDTISIEFDNGRPVKARSILVDITNRKKAEEEKSRLENQLLHAQKMESTGRLAGGIAHDFNNALLGIMGFAEMLKRRHLDTETLEGEAGEVIYSEAKRAADLTKQLLSFARMDQHFPVILNINRVIKGSIKVVEKIFEKKIQVTLDLANDIRTVNADRSQMDQILTNLLINANDAMPNGGRLKIKTTNVTMNEKTLRETPGLKPGNYVKTQVNDDGEGMTKDVLGRIFEPFFTTKDVGKGTGLGLATVYGIVQKHDGFISAESKPGEGAVFTIYLPATEEEEIEDSTAAEIVEGEGVILVIDDEEGVRKSLKNMLQDLGYSIHLASDIKSATRLYKKHLNEIDYILLDVIMPRTDGKETLIKLRKINPDANIIIMSGYGKEGILEDIKDLGISGFLQKPFNIQELSEMISKQNKT